MRAAMLKAVAALFAAYAAAGCAAMKKEWPREFEDLCEIFREGEPEGLSAVSRSRGGHYYCVDDRGGMLHEAAIELAEGLDDGTFTILRSVKLAGRVDLEGCAFDPLTGWVWVSDEHDTSIRAYDPNSGRMVAKAAVPEIIKKNVRRNRSIEGLAISPDGLKMYASNEDTLECDGEPSSRERGGIVRIQEFTRSDSADIWRPSRQLRYMTDAIEGSDYKGNSVSGVSALCVPEAGRLLVLEREMSVKKALMPTMRCRIYEVDPAAPLKEDGTVAKRLVWGENTMFANYEGLCRGPDLPDGSCTLVLVSDAGGGADARVLFLSGR